MALVRSGHLVFGVGLVVMGYAVLVIALAEQAQRAAAAASTQASAIESAAPAAPALAPTSTVAPVQPAAIPSTQVVAQAPSAAPPSSAGAAAGEPSLEGEGQRMFKFSPGGAVMSREEVQRLMAYGKVLARRPLIRVSIEGFGDLPGLEPLMAGIAKHRAKVAQTLLAKAGVSEDRITISVVDMGSDLRLARSIRVTTTPPLSEVEKP